MASSRCASGAGRKQLPLHSLRRLAGIDRDDNLIVITPSRQRPSWSERLLVMNTLQIRSAYTTVLILALGIALSACTPTDTDAVHRTPTPTASASASASSADHATPSPSPASSTPPSADSSSNNNSGSDSPIAATPAPAATNTVPDVYSAGCPANGVSIPAGAETSAIDDVDGDGKPDTQFFTEEPDFFYGISTASGATVMIRSDLAGPGKHSGWSARLESGLVVTVLDDSRAATLHAFVNCAFVTTTEADGSAADLYLTGFGDDNTGVQCYSGNGGRWVYGVLATRLTSGRYTITRSYLTFSKDGSTVTLSPATEEATDIAADDPRVALAMKSSCGDVPKVATSGR